VRIIVDNSEKVLFQLKSPIILREDERAHFRGTTSFRWTSPHQRTHHPDSSLYIEKSIEFRYNGLTHADLLFTFNKRISSASNPSDIQ